MKHAVYYTVQKELEKISKDPMSSKDRLRRVIKVFKELVSEEQSTDRVTFTKKDEYFICDGCSAEIFNRRYHCNTCRSSDSGGDYDLCVQCYQNFGKDHYHPMELIEKIRLSDIEAMLASAEKILADSSEDVKMEKS